MKVSSKLPSKHLPRPHNLTVLRQDKHIDKLMSIILQMVHQWGWTGYLDFSQLDFLKSSFNWMNTNIIKYIHSLIKIYAIKSGIRQEIRQEIRPSDIPPNDLISGPSLFISFLVHFVGFRSELEITFLQNYIMQFNKSVRLCN